MDFVLKTNSLSKKYGKFKALDNMNITVPKGAIYGLAGKNGAGKTTLIRVICGLQEPTSGDYTLYGKKNTERDIAKSRRRIGAIIESPAIIHDMSARDNLKHQYCVLGLPSFEGIDEILKLVGLNDVGRKKAGKFSLGMRQRLAIAIALCGDPDFLILDEPTNGLDPQRIVEKCNIKVFLAFIVVNAVLTAIIGMISTFIAFTVKGDAISVIAAVVVIALMFLATSELHKTLEYSETFFKVDKVNGVEYSDGDLTIDLNENGEISFLNSAKNLDEVQTGRLFDRFFTVRENRSSAGLGLAIAKTLVEQMGGTIGAKYSDGKITITVTFI